MDDRLYEYKTIKGLLAAMFGEEMNTFQRDGWRLVTCYSYQTNNPNYAGIEVVFTIRRLVTQPSETQPQATQV